MGEVLVKAQVYHVQINVRDAARSFPFYKAFLGYLDYRTVHETDTVAGFSAGGTDIWVIAAAPPHVGHGFHRKRPGLNHVAFRVQRLVEVELAAQAGLVLGKAAQVLLQPRPLAGLLAEEHFLVDQVKEALLVLAQQGERPQVSLDRGAFAPQPAPLLVLAEQGDRFREEFLAPRRLPALYETPREFPEYRPGYYAVFFEDPDRLKLEVVHIPGRPGG